MRFWRAISGLLAGTLVLVMAASVGSAAKVQVYATGQAATPGQPETGDPGVVRQGLLEVLALPGKRVLELHPGPNGEAFNFTVGPNKPSPGAPPFLQVAVQLLGDGQGAPLQLRIRAVDGAVIEAQPPVVAFEFFGVDDATFDGLTVIGGAVAVGVPFSSNCAIRDCTFSSQSGPTAAVELVFATGSVVKGTAITSSNSIGIRQLGGGSYTIKDSLIIVDGSFGIIVNDASGPGDISENYVELTGGGARGGIECRFTAVDIKDNSVFGVSGNDALAAIRLLQGTAKVKENTLVNNYGGIRASFDCQVDIAENLVDHSEAFGIRLDSRPDGQSESLPTSGSVKKNTITNTSNGAAIVIDSTSLPHIKLKKNNSSANSGGPLQVVP